MQTPLKWHGGKFYLANKIVALMPPHTRYLEPFAGGLSVLIAKPHEGIAEWANDLNGELSNFWFVLGHGGLFDQFVRKVQATPLSEEVFDDAKSVETYLAEIGTPWERAANFFIRIRQSRQGLGKDFCTPTSRTRRGMNENVSAWLSAVDGLADVHARLRRVEIWCRPAVEAITKLDGPGLLAYCDPPYLHETRNSTGEYGSFEMSNADHEELLRVLAGMKGKFQLSGYRSDLYDFYADMYGWRRVDFDLPNNASGSKSKERKTECLWMNYDQTHTH